MSRNIKLLSALVVLLATSNAWSAGFEKALLWSPRITGIAGAAASSVNGADSLLYNPAGLATEAHKDSKGEISGNFSPVWSKFDGVIASPTTKVEGQTRFSPVYGATASYRLGDKFGIGIGSFTVGGSKARYENVDFSGASAGFTELKPTIESDISIIEHSIGAGAEMGYGFRLGVAWRITKVFGRLQSASVTAGPAPGVLVLSAVDFNNISETRYNGWRAGLQWANEANSLGVGVVVRTPLKFITPADVTSKVDVNATTGLTEGTSKGEVGAEFPLAVDVGTHFMFNEEKTNGVYLQYGFTRYANNSALDLNATIPTPVGARPVPDLQLNWQNQHQGRIGFSWKFLFDMTWRAGYVYTSQVTPASHARAVLHPPGNGNTVALGTGMTLMDGKLALDGAFEYAFAKGDGTGNTAAGTIPGEVSAHGYTIHTGVKYFF